MGIEGISPNQLRIEPQALQSLQNAPQVEKKVGGLAQGKKIDPDEENKNENPSQESAQDQNSEENETKKEVINYDLSDTKKYQLKIDQNTNNILIVKKDTGEVIQVFGEKILSKLTGFLNEGNGILVNRKF